MEANRRTDVKEMAGYAIGSKTAIDIFWLLIVSVAFLTTLLLTLALLTYLLAYLLHGAESFLRS